MFSETDELKQVEISYTYPELEPINYTDFDPLMLADNLYYGNSVDTLSPTMESSIIVARNLSRLISNKLEKS